MQITPPLPPVSLGALVDCGRFRKRSSVSFVATIDGVTEARNVAGEMFGMERFIDVVKSHFNGELKQLIKSVLDEAQAFSAGRLVDDMAIVAARFL